MTTPLPGAVFDCVVFLQAAISRKGPAFACKELLDTGRVAVFLSPEVLAEITDVLTRPELQKKFKSLAPEKTQAFLQDLADKATSLADVPKQFTYARDPNDEPYVNLALAAGAQYLVTFDKDLLDLMNQATPEGNDFRRRFPGLIILTPVAFLQALSPKEEEPPAPGEATNPSTSAASGTGPRTPPGAVSPLRTATASAAVIARPSPAPSKRAASAFLANNERRAKEVEALGPGGWYTQGLPPWLRIRPGGSTGSRGRDV